MTQIPRKTVRSATADGIDTALVRVLAQLLQDTDLSEIEVEKGDFRVRVVRQLAQAPVNYAVPAPVAVIASPRILPQSVASDTPHPFAVPSPMVGSAYRRASPGSKAFVEVGDKVAAGDKILLIEAMKTFNDIVSPRSGIVTAIMIEDGMPVEYGQPLMVIE